MTQSNPQVRRRGRGRALEFLYGLSFTRADWRSALDDFWATFLTKDAARAYAEMLIEGVSEHREDLDAAIDGALRGWSPERVGRIERAILRIALFEIWFRPDVPARVAINEAIELAKAYGSDESPGFVNAVLDRLKDSSVSNSASQG